MINLSAPIAGCMRWGKWGAGFSSDEYAKLINECIENGITCFDHADIYGDYTTEAEFGKALKGISYLRDKFQLVTKCGIEIVCENRLSNSIKFYDSSKTHIIRSLERSLENFNTDYIDLLLIHRPDPLMLPEEVAEAITQLKQQGKILHFGVSNFYPSQTKLLGKYVDIEFNQLELSILHLKPFTNGLLDHCMQHNIKPMAWAPLGGGIISDETHPRYRSITSVATVLAKKYDTGLNQILIAWLCTHPSGIIPVVGTTKLERLLQAKEAFKIKLERSDWFDLYTASTGEDVP